MTAFHLRFEEATECPVYCPTHAVPLLSPTFDDDFLVKQHVQVHPDTLVQHQCQLLACILVSLRLGAPVLTPEAFRAPMGMLGQLARPHCQLARRVPQSESLLVREDGMGRVEALEERAQVGPRHFLRACCFSET